MKIEELPLPEPVKEVLISQGIAELFPPQQEAVHAGALDGKNLVFDKHGRFALSHIRNCQEGIDIIGIRKKTGDREAVQTTIETPLTEKKVRTKALSATRLTHRTGQRS